MEDWRRIMRWLKWALRAGVSVAVVIAALYSLHLFRTYDQRKIESELVHIAENGYPTKRFSEFRLVCFNDNNGSEQDDFLQATDRAGVDIKQSIQRCGVNGSCCDLVSDVAGVIGVIRGDEIQCVQIKRFVYLLENGRREACIAPSTLKVSKEKFSSIVELPGRPWTGRVGNSYYQIGERQK